MAISYNKKELEKKKQKKRLDKQKRKAERKASGTNTFEDMIAYVDENGVISSTPPEINKKEVDIENIMVSTPKQGKIEAVILEGRVEFFNSQKGYGFIKNTNTTDKYFFHISSAPESIDEGDVVTFDLERGKRGMNAVNVEFLEKK